MAQQTVKAEALSNSMLLMGVAILSLGIFVTLHVSQNAHILTYLFPAIGLGLGVLFYSIHPALYLSFTYWLWFLTPGLRRIIESQIGMQQMSTVMLTPYLVSALCIFTLVKHRDALLRKEFFPFTAVLLGIMYGFGIGVMRVGVTAALFDLLQWMVPVLLAFHIVMSWRAYPEMRDAVQKAFVWGVLVMGTYGVLQFISPAPWDAAWMINAEMASIGRPESFMVRVFSTMNAPGPFAMTMMAGLVLLFGIRGSAARIAAVPGYISLLLSLVRAAWGGWVLALLFVVLKIPGRLRTRLIRIMAATIMLSIPLFTVGPIADRVNQRIDTITAIQDDGSYQARSGLYASFGVQAMTNPIGAGIGATGRAARFATGSVWSLDSGILNFFYVLGWGGALIYGLGIGSIAMRVFRIREELSDQFAVASAAIAFAMIAMMVFGNQLGGPNGIITWSFLAFGFAATKYYQPD